MSLSIECTLGFEALSKTQDVGRDDRKWYASRYYLSDDLDFFLRGQVKPRDVSTDRDVIWDCAKECINDKDRCITYEFKNNSCYLSKPCQPPDCKSITGVSNSVPRAPGEEYTICKRGNSFSIFAFLHLLHFTLFEATTLSLNLDRYFR